MKDRLTLPCGADVRTLVRQVFDGEPPADAEHQSHCPHCRAMLERTRATVEDLRGVAAEPVAVPPSLLASVMARIRSAPRLVTVDVDPRGATAVSDQLVASVARRAALSVAEVTYASVIAADSYGSDLVALRVRLVVVYGPPLQSVADRVRDAIAREIGRITGLRLRWVDVAIDDLA